MLLKKYSRIAILAFVLILLFVSVYFIQGVFLPLQDMAEEEALPADRDSKEAEEKAKEVYCGGLGLGLQEKHQYLAALKAREERVPSPGFAAAFYQQSAEQVCPEDLNSGNEAATPASQETAKSEQEGTAPSSTESAAGASKKEAPPATAGGKEQEMVQMINAARLEKGLPALEVSGQLTSAARAKSADMVSANYFSHESPTYGGLSGLLQRHGVSYSCAGENLAMNSNGSVSLAFSSLMNSAPHRANILDRRFTLVGVGIKAKSDGTHYYTQLFVGR